MRMCDDFLLAGTPVAWKLMPHASPPMYALPASSHARRGAFASHSLWVTPHSDSELWPAGAHPYARGRNQGLPEWTQAVRLLFHQPLLPMVLRERLVSMLARSQ